MRLFVDNLTNIDFSYLCPTRGLVGETWLANIELNGTLDPQGMICDFGIVKKELRNWLDTYLDHCLLVPTKSPKISIKEEDSYTEIALKDDHGHNSLWTRAPKPAITLMEIESINAEEVAGWCLQHLKGLFGESVEQIKLHFSVEEIKTPFYHYSHGLKKHKGHCQRITHGHRSKLLIWRNNELCQKSIEDWASKWNDIYIASKDDLVGEEGDLYHFRYTAEQGLFELKLNKKACYFIETDTTVEFIAMHILTRLEQTYPNDQIRVKAFEGINKGAITESVTDTP